MSSIKELFVVGTQTITLLAEGISTSSTFLSGRFSAAIANTTNLDLDHLVSGFWTTNSSAVTANTYVQIWVVPCLTDDLASTQTWPESQVPNTNGTWNSAGDLKNACRLGATLIIDSTTANRSYYCADFSVGALFGGVVPSNYMLYLTQNSGQDAGDGPFTWTYQRIQATVT